MSRIGYILMGTALLAGCGGATEDSFLSESRKANGLVIILPGIEGESPMNHDIRQGLLAAGVNSALPIYRWGRPIPGVGLLLNQVDFVGNRIEASKISSMIVQYQDAYPGRPVYLIGHSGGGGVAVFAAEGLPEGRKVDGMILLSASISAGYDLSKALAHSKNGLVNFYNESDIGLLGIGTTVMGNVDGMRGPSAGLGGFTRPSPEDRPEKLAVYHRVFQVRLGAMYADDDAHAAATRTSFVVSNVAPWVVSDHWPAGPADVVAAPLGPNGQSLASGK